MQHEFELAKQTHLAATRPLREPFGARIPSGSIETR